MAGEDKPAASALIVGEVVEAIRQQDKAGSINVNILIQQVSEKADNPTEIILQTERVLERAQQVGAEAPRRRSIPCGGEGIEDRFADSGPI